MGFGGVRRPDADGSKDTAAEIRGKSQVPGPFPEESLRTLPRAPRVRPGCRRSSSSGRRSEKSYRSGSWAHTQRIGHRPGSHGRSKKLIPPRGQTCIIRRTAPDELLTAPRIPSGCATFSWHVSPDFFLPPDFSPEGAATYLARFAGAALSGSARQVQNTKSPLKGRFTATTPPRRHAVRRRTTEKQPCF